MDKAECKARNRMLTAEVNRLILENASLTAELDRVQRNADTAATCLYLLAQRNGGKIDISSDELLEGIRDLEIVFVQDNENNISVYSKSKMRR